MLTPYLELSKALGDLGRELIDQHLPLDATMGTMPDATVFRLHTVATINYRSGVACLREPETSLSAFSLLRGVLEAWAHLRFIADGAADGDGRCRALRYERGAMIQWSSNVRNAPPGFDHETWSAAHEQRAQDVEELWREFGCVGQQRSQKDTTATIKTIAREPAMEWVSGVWNATSGTVHMYGVEFALQSNGNGVTELVWARPSHRATWLTFLAASYAYMTTTAVELLCPGGSPAVAEFHRAGRVIIQAADLRRAIDGAFDIQP
jgi:hypothetical protein